MVGLYLDDGHPESEEYEGNYVYYDDRDPEEIKDVMVQLRGRGREDVAEWIGSLYAAQLETGRKGRGPWQRFAQFMTSGIRHGERLYCQH